MYFLCKAVNWDVRPLLQLHGRACSLDQNIVLFAVAFQIERASRQKLVAPRGTYFEVIFEDRATVLVIVSITPFQEDQPSRCVHEVLRRAAFTQIVMNLLGRAHAVSTDVAKDLL